MVSYDVLIKSGTVIDGTGAPPGTMDVGVRDRHIADMGVLEGATAEVVIDAAGKYVTPGFIDVTNHSDTHLSLFKYPGLDGLLMQGVTTAIGGNCGASLAPLASGDSILAIRKWADPSDINVNWNSVGEFLAEITKLRLGVNFGMFAGYGTLRRGVIGNAARLLDRNERQEIRFLLEESVREGALGLSLGLAYGHERVSPTEEIVEIAGGLAAAGGIIKLHLRAEGSDLIAAVNEAVQISREAGATVHISHFKVIGRKSRGLFNKALEILNGAAASGVAVSFDVSPYATTGSPLYALLPSWARQGGFSALFERLANDYERGLIIGDLKKYTLHYGRITVISAKIPHLVGRTLKKIAAGMGMEPEEAILEMIKANEGRISIRGRTVSLKNVDAGIAHPRALAASDGEGYAQEERASGNLHHPRSFGAFPHFLHRYVRDIKSLTAEEAIRKITGGPAVLLGIKERGVLAAGMAADIAVFDPFLFKDRATYNNPFRYPAGIEWVLVNGSIAVERGRPTGVRSGKVVQRK